MKPIVHNFYLLRSDADFDEYRTQHHSDTVGNVPPGYPCYVQQVIDGSAWASFEFLTPEDLTKLVGAMLGIGPVKMRPLRVSERPSVEVGDVIQSRELKDPIVVLEADAGCRYRVRKADKPHGEISTLERNYANWQYEYVRLADGTVPDVPDVERK